MNSYLSVLLSEAKLRFVPFLDWIFELKNPAILRADVIAGITIALVLIPQSMAYAQLAGLPPQMGLYACLLYTSPSPRDQRGSRMPSSA